MKISELIEFLNEQKDQHGDIEVWCYNYIDDDQGFIKCPLNKENFYNDKDFYLAEDSCHYDIAGGKKDMLVIDR